MIFKDHKATIQQILRIIPDGLISKLAVSTKVNYCAKVLQGERLFNLLLYAILKTDRISQRFLEDMFKSSHFKALFNYSLEMKVTHSSISEKLSKVNLDFFSQAYECIYKEFSRLYSEPEREKLHLIRVDSSMVMEAGTRLREGMRVGQSRENAPCSQKRRIKYSMAYDGEAVCKALMYTDQTYLSEDKALPELIYELIKTDKEHKNLYLFDRGISSIDSFERINSAQGFFICRIKANRKVKKIQSLLTEETNRDLGELEVVSDDRVHLYDKDTREFKPTVYRLLVARRKQPLDTTSAKAGKQKRVENEFYFLTNNLELSPRQIADMYRKRWDIEVFFRFLKQELNFKHFLSVNQNGIQVVLYMTLIAAMLLMIYKKINNIGFTTAKRRLMIEMEDIITAMAIIMCGGDIKKYGTIDYSRLTPK